MTRSIFRSLLIALCLTALTAESARSDSWFKFGGWGRKAESVSEESSPSESGLVSNENSDEIVDEESGPDEQRRSFRERADECKAAANDKRLYYIDKVNAKHAEHKARRADRRADRDQRRYDRRMYANSPNTCLPGSCYPQLNSSLYPCPRPDIPQEVGSTLITNQAFYPHEMLYAHQYRAIYPPFYYENKCGITCLPFIPKPCIAGTVVTVKYKTCLPCGFHPPMANVCGLNYPYTSVGIPGACR